MKRKKDGLFDRDRERQSDLGEKSLRRSQHRAARAVRCLLRKKHNPSAIHGQTLRL